MISRERVLMALGHEQPDRTPRDFWAEPAAWNRIFAYAGHYDKDRLLDDLEIDVRHLVSPGPSDLEVAPGLFQNFWGERFMYRPSPWGPVREDRKGALSEADTLEELEVFLWPSPDCLDYSTLACQCRRHETFALLYGFADIWQRPALVRGWERMFIDMIDQPELVHSLCRKFTDFYLEDYTRAAEISKGRIDIYLMISDLGTQRGPLISMPMFRTFVKPYLKELTDHIHSLGAKAMFHSCGMIHSFIPDLIRLGIDILDPIQPSGPAMHPECLQRQFGKEICFHGGIDMQHLLPKGSPGQVAAEVRRYCELLGIGGGYILSPAHFFQPEVPPENILAVYRNAP